MKKKVQLPETKRGWLFCLNAPNNLGSGSRWGFVNELLADFQAGRGSSQYVSMRSSVFGKPSKKGLMLAAGDGIAFYHGKKARRDSADAGLPKMRHVKPYQLTMLASISEVTQNPWEADFDSGHVTELAVATPKATFDVLSASPLLLSDVTIAEVVSSTGLGSGATGTFFYVDPPQWEKLLKKCL